MSNVGFDAMYSRKRIDVRRYAKLTDTSARFQEIAMNQERNDELSKLRSAALKDPRNAELRYLLGVELAEQRDYEGAVLELTAAVALNPNLHMARFQLGLLHLTLAQPHHTIEVLAPLGDLGDDAPLKHFKQGLEALIEDRFADCIEAMRSGIALNRENEPLNRDMTLIVDKAAQALADGERVRTPANENADSAVLRTDFSLYGDVTRH
jgi:tetratricopeptide (TPR) repeat protein